MSTVMMTDCTNVVETEQENTDLTESFKNSMNTEKAGPWPKEFCILKVSFVVAETSRS